VFVSFDCHNVSSGADVNQSDECVWASCCQSECSNWPLDCNDFIRPVQPLWVRRLLIGSVQTESHKLRNVTLNLCY